MQPMPSSLFTVAKRPLWRSYLVAYLLIGVGFLLGDIAATSPGTHWLEMLGATMFFAGLLVFAAAIANSVWFVLGGRLRGKGKRVGRGGKKLLGPDMVFLAPSALHSY
jgi:hypothetical protein